MTSAALERLSEMIIARGRTVRALLACAVATGCGWRQSERIVMHAGMEQELTAYWAPVMAQTLTKSEYPTSFAFRNFPRRALTISRDGREVRLNATVIERVYAPPGGMGKPVSRRTLIAWPDLGRYGIVAMHDTTGWRATHLRANGARRQVDAADGHHDAALGPLDSRRAHCRA